MASNNYADCFGSDYLTIFRSKDGLCLQYLFRMIDERPGYPDDSKFTMIVGQNLGNSPVFLHSSMRVLAL